MLADNIFLKIANKEIPARIVHEDEQCVAFHDVNPQAPVHVLIIPRKVIKTHADITEADRELLGHRTWSPADWPTSSECRMATASWSTAWNAPVRRCRTCTCTSWGGVTCTGRLANAV